MGTKRMSLEGHQGHCQRDLARDVPPLGSPSQHVSDPFAEVCAESYSLPPHGRVRIRGSAMGCLGEGQLGTHWEQKAMGWGGVSLRQGSDSSSGEGGQQEAQAIQFGVLWCFLLGYPTLATLSHKYIMVSFSFFIWDATTGMQRTCWSCRWVNNGLCTVWVSLCCC